MARNSQIRTVMKHLPLLQPTCPLLTGSRRDDDETEGQSGTHTLTRPKPLVKEPPLYKVMLLNDDYTPMDFVVHVLKRFFNKTETEATQIMKQVHNQGTGTAGVFSYEIAETKVYLVNDYSRKSQHPLKAAMEKA